MNIDSGAFLMLSNLESIASGVIVSDPETMAMVRPGASL